MVNPESALDFAIKGNDTKELGGTEFFSRRPSKN